MLIVVVVTGPGVVVLFACAVAAPEPAVVAVEMVTVCPLEPPELLPGILLAGVLLGLDEAAGAALPVLPAEPVPALVPAPEPALAPVPVPVVVAASGVIPSAASPEAA